MSTSSARKKIRARRLQYNKKYVSDAYSCLAQKWVVTNFWILLFKEKSHVAGLNPQ